MIFRHTLSRRDAMLVIMGAAVMHICGLLSRPPILDQSIIIDTQYHSAPAPHLDPLPPPIEPVRQVQQHQDSVSTTVTTTAVFTETRTQTSTVASQPTTVSNNAIPSLNLEQDLPSTSVTYHAPGWTLFHNLYMSNGTLYIISSDQSLFPEIRMMTSTGLPADNTPGNMAAREPTAANMDFITPEEAHRRWGGNAPRGEKHRVLSVEGNTVSILTILENHPLRNFPGAFQRSRESIPQPLLPLCRRALVRCMGFLAQRMVQTLFLPSNFIQSLPPRTAPNPPRHLHTRHLQPMARQPRL
jgi:hypothetical protein